MEDAEEPSTLDTQAILRGLAIKKRMAVTTIARGKAIQRQGQELERQGAAELADVEAFERVLKSLPTTDDELVMFERAAEQLPVFPQGSLRGTTRVGITASGVLGASSLNSFLKSQRDQVIFHCTQLLSAGVWRTTEELLESLLGRDVQLTAANPLQRVSQILSSAPQFRNQRGKGWALLDASPDFDSRGESEEEKVVADDAQKESKADSDSADDANPLSQLRRFVDSQR